MKKPVVIRVVSKKKDKPLSNDFVVAKQRIDNAANWLRKQDTDYRILIKQTKNLGDTLHVTPIARHYKTVYPNCKIAFIVGHSYLGVHEHNEDFDMVMPISSNLTAQDRIKLGNYMISLEGINKILCPSIHPFSEVWKSHVWSYPVISQQYFHNADIRPPENIKGGGKLKSVITKDDKNFAKNFVGNKKLIALEYHSYSHVVEWRSDKFKKFVDLAKKFGYSCVSFAGKNEGIIPGTVDGRGMTWRRTIAVLSECKYMIGVGSGITMLSCCADPSPTLIEIGVSDSIWMSRCGYYEGGAHFKGNDDPTIVMDWIIKEDNK